MRRAVLAEHFGTFKLEAVNESGESKYCVQGKVDFIGGKRVARTDGAGGPDSITRAYRFSLIVGQKHCYREESKY
jgi:hypothetical protein